MTLADETKQDLLDYYDFRFSEFQQNWWVYDRITEQSIGESHHSEGAAMLWALEHKRLADQVNTLQKEKNMQDEREPESQIGRSTIQQGPIGKDFDEESCAPFAPRPLSPALPEEHAEAEPEEEIEEEIEATHEELLVEFREEVERCLATTDSTIRYFHDSDDEEEESELTAIISQAIGITIVQLASGQVATNFLCDFELQGLRSAIKDSKRLLKNEADSEEEAKSA